MLGRFPVVLWVCPPLISIDQTEASPCLHLSTKLRKTSSSGPLLPERPRVTIHIFTLTSTTRQRYPRTRHPIKIASKNNSNDWVTPTTSSASKKKKNVFDLLPRLRLAMAPTGHPPLGSRKLQQQKPINFLYSARRTPHPPAISRR